MISQKNPIMYNDEYLNEFIGKVQKASYGETDELWRTLGYINASAFKGYGALSDECFAYNSKIYNIKEQAIMTLADKTKDIKFDWYCVYVRQDNGIQLSFHLHRGIGNDKEDLCDCLKKYLDLSACWDGVLESYTYTDANAYRTVRIDYQRKLNEDKEKKERRAFVLKEAIVKYLHHGMRRRSLGVSMSLQELKAFDPYASGYYSDVETTLHHYGISYSKTGWVQWEVLRLIPSDEWKELNTFNLKQE